jgi:hypothetical protein
MQTLLHLLTPRSYEIPESALSQVSECLQLIVIVSNQLYHFQALSICFHLNTVPNPITSNTAAATVRQIIDIVFDRVVIVPRKENKVSVKSV